MNPPAKVPAQHLIPRYALTLLFRTLHGLEDHVSGLNQMVYVFELDFDFVNLLDFWKTNLHGSRR